MTRPFGALLGLLTIGGVFQLSLSQSDTVSAIPELPWHAECTDGHCFMQILTPFDRGHGTEQAGLAVRFAQKEKIVDFVAVYVPADAVASAGLTIAFVDSVRDGEKWTLARATGFYAIPITDCTKDYCVSRVHPALDSGDGKQLDLISELRRRRHLWVMFRRTGESEPSPIMIPVYRFDGEFAKLLNESSRTMPDSPPEPPGEKPPAAQPDR